MRVMVTGGAGYIGSVVAEVLLARGHSVCVFDNLSKGHRDAVPSGAKFIRGDLRVERDITAAFIECPVDAVVHMAAQSLVGESVQDPAKYYEGNVVAGLRLLDAMRDASVQHIVFSSTAAVYGEPKKQPIEEMDPTAPTNPYGATKLAFERALQDYGHAYGLKHVSLRYFNAAGASLVCGERHDPETHLIPNILQVCAGRAQQMRVFGADYPTPDGTCIRDYIHVLDLAEAHALSLDALQTGHLTQAVFNVGCGGDGYSVREVMAAAERVTGVKVPFTVEPRRAGDPAVLVAASTRIRDELGFIAKRQSLDEIIGSAWRFMQGNEPDEVRA